ncbi:MAG: hypothetical protein GX358_03395 [candidate division WS1 bacterium]|nr:hypothetical protein [candidate division WS1 bacterium]
MQDRSRRYPQSPLFLLAVVSTCWLLTGLAALWADVASPEYRVQRGDALHVYVFDEEMLTGAYVVGAAGSITLPVVGQIPVVGRNIAEIRVAVARQLSEVLRDPVVTVRLDEATSTRLVFMSGYVENTGPATVPFGFSVRDAVLIAGPTDRADLSRVTLSRQGEPTQQFDLRGLRADHPVGPTVPIEYNDAIYVPRLDSVVTVLGEVQQPGSVVLPENETLTVLEVISKLGQGFAPRADMKSALLLRPGVSDPMRIDLQALLQEGDISQNYQLQGGDVVLVRRAEEIAVVGQVNSPVVFYSSEPVKLTEAVIRAGGFNAESDLANATVFRDGEYIPVNLESLWRFGDMSHNIALDSGDTLIIPEKVPDEVVLLGALEHTGPVNITNMRNTSLLKIISVAKPTPQADLRTVQVYRDDTQLTVNLKSIEQTGDMSGDIQLQPGDVVMVKDALKVYVIGAVGSPGIYPYDPDLSLFDYITQAGLGQTVGSQVGAVVRIKDDGTTEVIDVDLSQLRVGELPMEVTIQAGDIIYFPPLKPRKSFWDHVRENLWILSVINILRD